jgi:hypothetical protein
VPIPFALPLGFLLGVVFAWVSRDELARDRNVARPGPGTLVVSRPILVVSAFASLVYAPIVGYFVWFHGDWSYLYVYPHARIPSAVDVALVLVAGMAVPLGTGVATPASRAKKLGVVVRMGAAPAVLCAMGLAWGARRLSVSATYAQFHGSFGTTPIGASTLGRGVLFMTIVGALGVAWSVRLLARATPPEPLARARRRAHGLR